MDQLIEKIAVNILPLNCQFTDQQESVIKYSESCNIVAGPGSGKTSSLIAKYVWLLNKNQNNLRGVCLITHTNVAVNEIKEGLKKMGYDEISHPNFIGTIQEFINKFYAKKAFHKILGNLNMQIVGNDEFQSKFDEIFMELKPRKYTSNHPNPFYKKIILKIEGNEIKVESDAHNFYKDAFNKSIEILCNKGIIPHEYCLDLAKWYINENLLLQKKALENRFSHIILDEAQDTNAKQYEILKILTDCNNIIFQKFGDPFQALYNLYDGYETAWKPFSEPETKLEITHTSRFGSNIVNIIDKLSLGKYKKFTSNSKNNSFSPYCIIYKNPEHLKEKYNDLICCLENQSLEFKSNRNKDVIVSSKHDDIAKIFSNYSRKDMGKSKNVIKAIVEFINQKIFSGVITKENDWSLEEEKQLRVGIVEIIKILIQYNDKEILENKISTVIERYFGKKKYCLNTSEIIEKYQNISDFKPKKNKYKLGTIHSVKGETHRSTMLIANSVFSSTYNGTEYTFAELIFPIILNENYGELNENLIKQALKLAYVAMSRPTHLMILAVPKTDFREKYETKLYVSGWNIVK